MTTRKPCVAGKFYPGSRSELEAVVAAYSKSVDRKKRIAVIAPHAGYVYSGAVAGSVYSTTRVPDSVVLIGPNHTGRGKIYSVMAKGSWETPVGNVPINEKLAKLVLECSDVFMEDSAAHEHEHSLEVQLPFLLYANHSVKIVPITVMDAPYERCAMLGEALADAIKEHGEETLIAVSSDMNHYEDEATTRIKDDFAIKKILALDAEGLLKTVSDLSITMCGVIPAAIAIEAAKHLGATRSEFISYATSGKTSGDFDQVVGYAGVAID